MMMKGAGRVSEPQIALCECICRGRLGSGYPAAPGNSHSIRPHGLEIAMILLFPNRERTQRQRLVAPCPHEDSLWPLRGFTASTLQSCNLIALCLFFITFGTFLDILLASAGATNSKSTAVQVKNTGKSRIARKRLNAWTNESRDGSILIV